MKVASAYKALCQEDKLFLLDTAQRVAMLVDKPPKSMDYFRKQLLEFGEKWEAWKTAFDAERKGKWEPSMGKPDNPLETIWPRFAGPGRFPFCGGDIRHVLGAYALLAVIHDNVLPRLPSIAKGILPKELVNTIWRDLVTGANEEHQSIFPGATYYSRSVIPSTMIENFLGGVETDIENHFAPKNSPRKVHPYFEFVDRNHFEQENGATQKLAANGDLAKLKPAETGQEGKPAEEEEKQTPRNDSSLIYQADAAEFYNIPKSYLSKAAKKKPSEPGYLWSGTVGGRRFYRKEDLQRLSRSRQRLRNA